MAQKAQVIDVTKSYVPGDPNAFPANLVNTNQEDGEEKSPNIMPFEGYNFLPTPYGYRSYFGTTNRLNVPQVPARVQFILSYQSDMYINNLIALCEDGIWVIDPTNNTNTWKHVVAHTFDAEVFEEWTYCIIENIVYMYKQGKSLVYHTSNTDDVPNGLSISIQSFTPSFLNMAGQMGIFRAGTRLGFWDSANSISWSSNLNLQDFTPSLENLAGNTIFGLVTGRVVHVREQGEGFVVYSTKSIVGVSFSSESNMLWDSHLISDVCGIAYGREVCFGTSNNEHYVHSTIGMHRVGSYNGLTKVHEFTPVATELSDILSEERNPIYLDCIGGRYLYIHSISDTYINGKVSFTSVTVEDLNIDLVFNIEPTTVSKELFVKMIQNFERNTADDTYAATLVKYTADGVPFDLIEWDVSYRAISPLGLYEKLQVPALGSTFAYQNASTLNRTSIGWSDRTPIEGIFTPVSGDYNSLDSGVILPTYSDFLIRETKEDDFSKPISKVLRFQTDAFTHEDNKGTYNLSYQLRKGCGTEPSYLAIKNRVSHGLVGGMYNIASHWKDYEKRQKLVIDNLTQVIEDFKPFNWTAYSVDGTLESVIENPVYEIFDLFKPYGNTGIAPVGKGLFFYRNYREYYDCVVGAFRKVTDINAYKEIDNCEFNSPVPYSIQDGMQIDVTVGSGSGGAAFPNPELYPASVSITNGGTWSKPTDGYFFVIYCLVEIATGEVSDYMPVSTALGVNTNSSRIMISLTNGVPEGYACRVIVVADRIVDTDSYRKYYYKDFVISGVSYGLQYFSGPADGTMTTSFPATSIHTETNTYTSNSLSGWTLSSVDAGEAWYNGTTNFYAATLANGAIGNPVLLGSFTGDGVHSPSIISPSTVGSYVLFVEIPAITGYGSFASTITMTAGTTKVFKPSTFDGGNRKFKQLPDYSYRKPNTWNTSTSLVQVANFPNPYNYPVSGSQTYNGTSTYILASADYGYTLDIRCSIIDGSGNESAHKYINNLMEGYQLSLSVTQNLPAGYKYRIYACCNYNDFVGSLDFSTDIVKYVDIDLVVGIPFVITSWSAFPGTVTSYPMAIINNDNGNRFVPAITTSGFSVVFDYPGTMAVDVYVYAITSSGQFGPAIFLASGTVHTEGSFTINVPAYVPGFTYRAKIKMDHPNYKYTRNILIYPGANVHSAMSYSGGFSIDSHWVNVSPISWAPKYHYETVGSTTYSTTIPLRNKSNTFIQDLIAESQHNGISFLGLDEDLEFQDMENMLQGAPYSLTGAIPLLMQKRDGTGDYQAQCTITHKVSLINDWNLESGDGVVFNVSRISQETADAYPFLVQPKGVGVVGTYRSHNEAYVRLAGYGAYLQATMSSTTGPNGDQYFRPSSNVEEYYSEFKDDRVLIKTNVWNALTSRQEIRVVLIMKQIDGFIYEYKVDEEPFGSIIDNKKVDLTGSSLVPTLDGEGIYNTLGAFFMPKNKISATLNAGTLTLGASSSIGEYEAKEAEILDFLTPSNNVFEVSKYLLPPTYDAGERWYLVKDANKIYDSGGVFNYRTGTIAGIDNLFWNTVYYLNDFVPYDIPTDDTTIIQESLGIIPGSTFILQDGNISISYPTFKGAHVFDLFLKKWGKMKEDYKIIFSYSALNSGNSGIIPYSNFGMDCGVVLASNSKISLFDIKPRDSWMRIGKIGYYRLGMTRAYEVKTMFRSPSSGKITLDTSLDGRTLEVSLKTEQIFNNKVKVDMYPDISGRWHTIKIEGNYDLQYLEFRGTISGRR